MAQAVGHAVLPIVPSLQGIGKELAKQLNVPASQAADKAGADIRKGMASGVDDAAKAVEKAQWRVKKAAEESADAESKLRAAKEKSAASQANLQAAEEKLSKLRSSGKATSEQILKAEADISRKRAAVETASNNVAKAERGVESAMTESKRAADSLAKAQDTVSESGKKADTSTQGFNLSLKKVAVAATAAVGSVVAMGKAAYSMGAKFDDAYDSIRVGTGASGEALDGLQQSLRNVAANSVGVGGDIAEIGTTLADLNTRLGVTGEPLEKLTSQFQQLQGMGIDADINKVTGALQQFGIKGEAAPEAMDKLFRISQATGRSITEITDNLSKSGPALKQFGFNLEESAGLMGALDKAGLDSEKTLGSMTRALSEFAKEGKNPQEALQGTIKEIDGLVKAGDSVKAIDLANKIFGARGGAGFVAAVQSGKLQYDDFMSSIGASGDTINGVAEETADFAEKWDQFKLKAMLAIEPVASLVFSAMAPALEIASGAIQKLASWVTDTLVPGLKAFGEWVQRSEAWLKPLATTVGVLAGAFAALAIQAKIAAAAQAVMAAGGLLAWFKQLTVVTKLQTAAQAALNLVMNANPIFLIGTAIAALVAGLVVFFTKTETGKQIWQSFMDLLNSAWQWLKDTFTPVFEWVGQKASEAWALIKAGWDVVWGGIQAAWVNVVQPVFNAFLNVAKITIGVIGTIILAPLLIAWNALSAGIKLGWESIIKPAFDAMATVSQWLWNNVLKPVFTWIGAKWSELGNLIRLIWDTVIRVAWDLLKAAALFMWNNVLKPTFEAIKAGFTAVGNLIRFIYDTVIKPTWDAFNAAIRWLNDNVFQPIMGALKRGWSVMGDLIRSVADKVIHPVFDGLKRGLGIVRDTFQRVVDGIRTIWDKLRSATARPVKFVIDSVWNKGIVGAWNKIAGFVPGLDKVSEFKPGWMGAYKTGGVLPGYTPGRDVHDFYSPTGGRLMLSGGEAIMRPEWTRAVGGPAAVEKMNQAARKGNLRTLDKHDNHSAAHKHALGGVLKFASGGVVEAMTRIVQKKYPMLQMTSGYRPGDGGYHGMGLAGDFSNGSGNTPQQLALAHDIAKTYPGSAELIYDAPGWSGNIKNGRNVGAFGQFYTMAQAGPHHHHVHWAMNTPPTMDFGGGVFKGGSGGGGIMSAALGWVAEKARGIWEKAIEPIKKKISGTWDNVKGSLPAKIPGGFFKTVKDKAWEFIKSKFPLGDSGGGGNANWNPGAGAEQWRSMLIRAFKFQGEEPRKDRVDALIRQIHTESRGDPNIAQQIVDVNGTGEGAGVGLYQVIPTTWEAFRDPRLSANRRDPWAQNNFAVRYFRDKHHWDTSFVGQGHGWKTGGVLPENLALFDSGGMLQPNMVATNKTNKPEPVFTAEQWNVLKRSIVSKAEAQDWRGMFNELGKAINKFGVVANKLGQRAQADFARWQRGEHIMTADDKRLATPNEMRLQLGYMMGSEAASEVGKIFGFSDSMVKGLLDMAGFKDPKFVDETGQVTVQARAATVEPAGKASIEPAKPEPKAENKKPEGSNAPVIRIENVTIHGGASEEDGKKFARGVQSEWERVRGRMARVN